MSLEVTRCDGVTVDDGQLVLGLRRVGHARGGPAVLLLHGANSSGDTFLVPHGGLAGYLSRRGFDVWILDWRGSPHVVDPLLDRWPPLGGSVLEECKKFYTVDHVAEVDIPMGIEEVRRKIGGVKLSVLGHCVGAGALGIAMARGLVDRFDIGSFVLSTLGLFYEVPWNGWAKAEDYIIERVLHDDPACRGVNPKKPGGWPRDVESSYHRWPHAWLPGGTGPADAMLRRMAFMVGQPYSTREIDPSIEPAQLEGIFGNLHMGLYWHLGQMVRRGYAARFNAPDVIDRARLHLSPRSGAVPDSHLVPTHFKDKRVTLLAAAQNQLWHRDSMDLMYEWLHEIGTDVTKLVFARYNIQELLWGPRSAAEVYPEVARRLAS